SETVLVILNEARIRLALTNMLYRLGYRTRDAATAQEALEILQQEIDIDLVLTDEGALPMLEARWTSAQPPASLPKILLVRGWKSQYKTRLHDVESTIEKPFTPAQLGERIRSILSARKAPPSSSIGGASR